MKAQNTTLIEYHNYHYLFVGFAQFEDVLKKLKKQLPFYRFKQNDKSRFKEIFYDEKSHMLSDSGIIISKSISKKDCYLNFRRLSMTLKKRSLKYRIDRCDEDDQPKDYASQIADAIIHSFSSSLTIDIENIIKKTTAIASVDVRQDAYEIICGTGYRANLYFENAEYKNLENGKKAEQIELKLSVPIGDYPETQELLDTINKHISGVLLTPDSRFEMAKKLLFTDYEEVKKEVTEEEEE